MHFNVTKFGVMYVIRSRSLTHCSKLHTLFQTFDDSKLYAPRKIGKCSSPELTSPLDIDLKFYLELLKDFGLIVCMGGAICTRVQVLSLGRGVGSPCRWSYRRLSCLTWILGTKLRSSKVQQAFLIIPSISAVSGTFF